MVSLDGCGHLTLLWIFLLKSVKDPSPDPGSKTETKDPVPSQGEAVFLLLSLTMTGNPGSQINRQQGMSIPVKQMMISLGEQTYP